MRLETKSERVDRLVRERRQCVVPHRTLPARAQWLGHDVEGRGAAPARRLRQIARGLLPTPGE